MHKRVVVISILISYMVSVTVFAAPPPDIEGQTNYGTEWTITGAEFRGNQTIILDGNLTIESGGSLTLYNVTLIMNNTNYDGQYNIEVKNGGTLNILSGSNITDSPHDIDDGSPSDYEYMFWVREGSNFTMKDSELHECGYDLSNKGLFIEADGVEIKNSVLSYNYFAILLISSNGSNIIGNRFLNNRPNIYTYYSYGNNISNNNISSGSTGILLEYSSGNNITGNNASNCASSIKLYRSHNNNVLANNAFFSIGAPGIYLYYSNRNNITGNNASNNFVGIRLDSSIKNNITDNTALNNDIGILLESSSGNNVTHNNASDNDQGIRLYYSKGNNITSNDADLNTFWGIYIFLSDGNNITDNTVLNNAVGINLDSSNWNNITGNNASNNVEGIFLDSSTFNNITGNNASNNAGGIVLSESSNNFLTGNNASSNSNDGIHLVDSYDNDVFSNVVIQNGIEGIHLMNSGGNTITDNYASDNNMGIYLFQSSGNYIIGNNVSKSIDGIRLSFSSGNEIIGNNATSNNVAGIYLRASNWNTITRNNAYSNNVNGIYLDLSSNNTVNNCNIYSNNFYGVGAREGAQDNYIVNSTISNSGSYDFNLYDNSSIIAINTTFNKTKVYFDDPNSTLTVQWYMHIYVVSTYGLPISGAGINITNITDVSIQSSPSLTENDGFVRWIVVTDYIQNDTNGGSPGGDNKVYHTPHNVTATLNGNTGYAKPEPVMDSSKVIIIILDTEKPMADAGIDSSIDEDELHMFDGSGSSDIVGISNWTWDFDDGTFGYGETPTHTYTSSGFYVVVLNVTDTAGNWDIDTVTIFVNNVPPTADAGNDNLGVEGEHIYFDGSNSIDTASDIDSLIYIWDFGDGTTGSGKMVNHSYEDNGTYTTTLQVTDDDGTSSIDSITIAINNTAPEITPITPQFLQEDQIYTLQVIATDVKGDTLTFSDNTTMFDINPVTGVISFTPTNADVGTHIVNVTIVDDDGAESYLELHMDIQNTNDVPIITSSPITIAVENSSYYYNLTVVDDDLDTIAYELDLKPDGMAIDSNGRITWIPTYQQASQTYMVIVNVSDGSDFVTQTFSVAVINVNDKPTITSTPIFSVTEDSQYNYDVNGIDVDIGDMLIFSLDAAPIGMSMDSSTGLITWVPMNDQVGDNFVIVNVTDMAGAFATQEFIIAVANSNDAPVLEVIGPLIATEGVTFSYIVTAIDIDAGDMLTFSDDSDLFDINSTTGNITFVPSNDDVGKYVVKITVTDSSSLSDFENILFTVVNVNDPPTLIPIEHQTLLEDAPFTLTVTATDLDIGDSMIYLDNTTLFDINQASGVISFTPTNEDVGTFMVNLSVKDGNGSIAYQTVLFTILNVNDQPLTEPVGRLTAEFGKMFSYTVMVTDVDQEDILTFSDDTELFDIDQNTGEISFTPAEKDEGLHYVTITVTDGEGESDQMTLTFNILGKKGQEPFDFIWILLLIIVGLVAFFIGNMMRGKGEIGLPEEKEEDLEPEEIEMELLEEEPLDEDKESPPSPQEEEEIEEQLEWETPEMTSEEEDTFEFEVMDEEGAEGEEETQEDKNTSSGKDEIKFEELL